MSAKITCCPKCKGESGFRYSMKVTHAMGGCWGEEAECGDSSHVSTSLAECCDCDAKFNYRTAEGKTKKDDTP